MARKFKNTIIFSTSFKFPPPHKNDLIQQEGLQDQIKSFTENLQRVQSLQS